MTIYFVVVVVFVLSVLIGILAGKVIAFGNRSEEPDLCERIRKASAIPNDVIRRVVK